MSVRSAWDEEASAHGYCRLLKGLACIPSVVGKATRIRQKKMKKSSESTDSTSGKVVLPISLNFGHVPLS